MTFLRAALSINGRIDGLVYYACTLLSRSLIAGSLFISSVVGLLLGHQSNDLIRYASPALIQFGYFLLEALRIWIALAATIRRLHDLGASGFHATWIDGLWIVAFFFAALLSGTWDAETAATAAVTLVPSLALGIFPGQPHRNRFGWPRF